MESAELLFREIEQAGLIIDNAWLIKQNDTLDRRTAHIYDCRTIDELRQQAQSKSLSEEEFMYSLHRWRNFKRHEAWMSLLFEQVPQISLPENAFHKKQDFFIATAEGESVPFDLKVTRYPKALPPGAPDKVLAEWFYENQSKQGRFHLANRFFIVGQPEAALYDISLARQTVGKFVEKMSNFRHFIEHSDGTRSRAVILRQKNE